ncbi:hypothetical protein BKA62DRAFT_716877 [Auriculariales sp. MPI-PUGE-AT-0066]|nr:hypothetical protein BKA62DRAFT_716877 [Auriculariales sp. MPI-PUGE-AT-0066]
MVVLAAAICTKAGKPLVSRQFREMSRARIESLLSSFTTLIPPGSQHTSVETADVRYVYQPLDDLYVLLVTNKASNILQDIDSLHLVARVVSDTCRAPEEREILAHAFTLLAAFDEIFALGFRENINLMQVRNVLEMDSHEEKIQDIIARNKEAEAKEELKRRAKQLEIQRREQQRRTGSGGGSSNYLNNSFSGSYSPVNRAASPVSSPSPFVSSSTGSNPTPKAPTFKGSGMKLGAKKVKQTELLAAVGGDDEEPAAQAEEPEPEPTPAPAAAATTNALTPPPGIIPVGRGSLPDVERDSVHVQIRETLSLSLTREGGIRALELKGDLNLTVNSAPLAKARLQLKPLASGATSVTFKQHPNVAKFAPGGDRVVALKDKNKAFPVGQPLGVLKWRYADKDESVIPLSINVWPTLNAADGTADVSVEYELEAAHLTLSDFVLSIPLPAGASLTSVSDEDAAVLNEETGALEWRVASVSADEASGSLEFSVSGATDVNGFFPVHAGFVAPQSLFGIEVDTASVVDGDAVEFSQDTVLAPELYVVS